MGDLRSLAAVCLILLAGCATPVDRKPQMANIQGAVAQTFDGDAGALIFNGYEAARQAEAADVAIVAARANTPNPDPHGRRMTVDAGKPG
jgi:hypothetical protein